VVVALPERLAELAQFVGQTMGSTIAIKVDLPADLWPVQVDDEQLQVAILNLIVNARDAMPAGGEIRISARNLRLPASANWSGWPASSSRSASRTPARALRPTCCRACSSRSSPPSRSARFGLGLSQVISFAKQSERAGRDQQRAPAAAPR